MSTMPNSSATLIKPAVIGSAMLGHDPPRPAASMSARSARLAPIGSGAWLRIGFCALGILLLLGFLITLHLPTLMRISGDEVSLQQQVADLLDSVERAQASARNFLLSDDPHALEVYAGELAELPGQRAQLAAITIGDSAQARRIADLGPMIDSLLAELARSVLQYARHHGAIPKMYMPIVGAGHE